MNDFFSELKRRNVIRAAILYLGAVWALAQGIAQLGPSVGAPAWVTRWFLVAAAIGLPFSIAFAWFYEFTPEGLKLESEIDPTESIPRHTGRKLDFAIIGVLTVAVVLLLTDRFVLRHGVNEITAVPIPEKSIAVLPLMNSTGDAANEYFSDGMSEEFISSLSRLKDLKVIGRTSSFQFKGKTDDSKAIGEKLGVYYLLEGSVRKSADRVRIAVALIKAADGANVWSETYDRELKDIFAVQSEIAGAVAKQLKVALLGNNGQTAQLATAATPSNQNVEAYNALLLGNFYYNRSTADDMRKAIGYFKEAIRLDPSYALAYAKLSLASHELAVGYGGIPVQETEEAIMTARASARRALDLDPNLPEAHIAQGLVLLDFDFNLVAAEAEYRRAFGLAPRNAPAVLVDGGPPGDELVAELHAEGVDRLGAAVVTHDQSDHAAGIAEALGRVPIAGPIAYGRGTEVTLTLEDAAFQGSSSFVLASVLEQFLARFASINSFSRTVLRSSERGEVARWPMRLGNRPTL